MATTTASAGRIHVAIAGPGGRRQQAAEVETGSGFQVMKEVVTAVGEVIGPSRFHDEQDGQGAREKRQRQREGDDAGRGRAGR